MNQDPERTGVSEIEHEPAQHRFVATAGGAEAEIVYRRDGDRLYLLHTEVPAAFRGHGTGGHLVSAALDLARLDHFTIVPWCPFARRWLREHRDLTDGVQIDWSPPPRT